MNNDLTITEQMMTMPLAGETEAGSAQEQPARDNRLGYRRNVVAAVSHSRDCRIRQNISEISPMPKKASCRRQGSLLTANGNVLFTLNQHTTARRLSY